MRDLSGLAAGNREKLVRAINRGNLGNDVSRRGESVVVDHEAASDRTSDVASERRNATQILRAVVVGNEVNEFAIGRNARNGSHSIKSKRQDFGEAAFGRRNGDVARCVIKKARL